MEVPETCYLSTERGSIAYQSFGAGDRTIVWTGPPIISIETRWDDPGTLRLWEFLGGLGRVVIFDYRGFGISEHLPLDRVGQLEELTFDLAAVVSGLATPPIVLLATGMDTAPAVDLIASHPQSVERLVLLNAVARQPAPADSSPEEWLAELRGRWGSGEVLAAGLATASVASGEHRRRAARIERIAGTPAVAAAAFLTAQQRHISDLLPRVTVPTLVVHTGDAARITPEMTQQVAGAIPGAVYLSRPSALFNWGEWDSDIRRFVTGDDDEAEPYRDLAAVLFTDIVGSTEQAARVGDAAWRDTLDYLDAFVQQEARTRHGRVVKQTGDGHLVEFARPSDALAAARSLVAGAPRLGFQFRAGVHFAEVERRPGGDIGGIGVHLAARIAALAGPSEILVSRTVCELTAGARHTYTDRGLHQLKGIPGEWQFFAVTNA